MSAGLRDSRAFECQKLINKKTPAAKKSTLQSTRLWLKRQITQKPCQQLKSFIFLAIHQPNNYNFITKHPFGLDSGSKKMSTQVKPPNSTSTWNGSKDFSTSTWKIIRWKLQDLSSLHRGKFFGVGKWFANSWNFCLFWFCLLSAHNLSTKKNSRTTFKNISK